MTPTVPPNPHGTSYEPCASPVKVAVTRLSLTNFRSYPCVDMYLDPQGVLLTGGNGAGKTNILAALSLLTPGRGLFGSSGAQMAYWYGNGAWAVAATVIKDNTRINIGTGIEAPFVPDNANSPQPALAPKRAGKRIVKIDGKAARRMSALVAAAQFIWMTPSMDRIFTESASARRRFLDRLTVNILPEHADALMAYERAMRARNRLLVEGDYDATWLDSLEQEMASHGVVILKARRFVVEKLNNALNSPPLLMENKTELCTQEHATLADDSVLENEKEQELRKLLYDSRQRDAKAKRCLAQGPHRSDFMAVHCETKTLARDDSTGEQKFLLACILLATAHVMRHIFSRMPVLLLDDIATHLDARHCDFLGEAILNLDVQAWVSAVKDDDFPLFAAKAQRFHVTSGKIEAKAA